MIAALAVVGKLNNPLYIKIFENNGSGETDTLKFHYIVHTSLDVLEEKAASARKKEGLPTSDHYLGFLFPTDVYKVYGYVTSTKTKLIAVMEDVDVKDSELSKLFSRLHNLVVDTSCNPFYKFDQKIESKKFDDKVSQLVKAFVTS